MKKGYYSASKGLWMYVALVAMLAMPPVLGLMLMPAAPVTTLHADISKAPLN